MAVKEKDKFIKLKNPYTFGVPVRGEGKFFGREEELQLIFDTLENVPRGQKQDIVVLGPRRIGKSSLLYRLVDLLTPNKEFVPVYVDVQNIKPRTMRVLFYKILQRIRQNYRQQSPQIELPTFKTLELNDISADLEYLIFDEDMTRLNHAIEIQDLPRLVLIFDEVELLLEFGGKDTLEWFRSLIQSLLFSTFVVAGSEQLYSLTQDYGSPFYNIFKTIELHPLTTEAAQKLILAPAEEIGMTISPLEVEKILTYTGNNPYFIQGICHYLVEALNFQNRRHAYSEDVDRVIDQSVEYLSAQFAYVWGGVSQVQKAILYNLVKIKKPQTAEALILSLPRSETFRTFIQSKQEQEDTFDDLLQQQILKLTNNTYYWFVILLFADWILSKADNEEIVNYIATTEPTITRVYNIPALRQLLSKTFSDDQITFIAYDYFRPVYDQFSAGMGKHYKLQRLIEYVERTQKFDELLELIKEENPAQYEAFEKDLYQ